MGGCTPLPALPRRSRSQPWPSLLRTTSPLKTLSRTAPRQSCLHPPSFCPTPYASAPPLFFSIPYASAVSPQTLEGSQRNLIGNMVVCSGAIAYQGPFTAPYRARLNQVWRELSVLFFSLYYTLYYYTTIL